MTFDVLAAIVMISGADDTETEVGVVEEAITTWNRAHAAAEHVVFIPRRYLADRVPSLRKGVDVRSITTINADVVIGLFKYRLWGTTPRNDYSGEEEVEARSNVRRVHAFFWSGDAVPRDVINDEHQYVQWKELGEYRKSFDANKNGSCDEYSSSASLTERVLQVLLEDARELKSSRRNFSPSPLQGSKTIFDREVALDNTATDIALDGTITKVEPAAGWLKSWRWILVGSTVFAVVVAGLYVALRPAGSAVNTASTAGSPILVQSVSSSPVGVNFVLQEPLLLGNGELDALNREAATTNVGDNPSFATNHNLIPLNFTIFTMTLSTNIEEKIRIVDMRAIKECAEPFDGTYFNGYTQGGTDANVQLGFDLDTPEARAQKLVGDHPQGPPFFSDRSVPLTPGDSTTITAGAFTSRYTCSFTIEVEVATPRGEATQIIDDHGKPFQVSAKAGPTNEFPLSGYQNAYIEESGYIWRQVDPKTYPGR